MRESVDLVEVVGAGIAGKREHGLFRGARAGLRAAVVDQGPGRGLWVGPRAASASQLRANPPGGSLRGGGLAKGHLGVGALEIGGENGYRRNGFPVHRAADPRPDAREERGVDAGDGGAHRGAGRGGVKRLLPFAETDGTGAAAWEPESGHADPWTASRACWRASAAAAARRRMRDRRGLLTEGGRVAGVRLGDGTITARSVVLVAGAGIARARRRGRGRPALCSRCRSGRACCTACPGSRRCRARSTTPPSSGTGVRSATRSSSARVTRTRSASAASRSTGRWSCAADTDELVSAATRLVPRIPALNGRPPAAARDGLDSRTPDGHALAGPVPGVLACSSSPGQRQGVQVRPLDGTGPRQGRGRRRLAQSPSPCSRSTARRAARRSGASTSTSGACSA